VGIDWFMTSEALPHSSVFLLHPEHFMAPEQSHQIDNHYLLNEGQQEELVKTGLK
jgi:hypothetical protein